MGQVISLSRRREATNPQVYPPVNYRPPQLCRTMVFQPGDGNDYELWFDAEGINYCKGEERPDGYHVVELPGEEGLFIRYVCRKANGHIYLTRRKGVGACDVYPEDDVWVVGHIYAWVKNFATGARYEYIEGPAFEGDGELLEPRELIEVG